MLDKQVGWLIPQRVIYFPMLGEISYDVFSETNAAVAALVPQGQAPVHLIADMLEASSFLMDVRWIANNTVVRDKRVGYVHVLGTNRYLKFSTEAVRLLTMSKIEIFDELIPAYHALSLKDRTLPQKLSRG